MKEKTKRFLATMLVSVAFGVLCGGLAFLFNILGWWGCLMWYEALVIPAAITLFLFIIYRLLGGKKNESKCGKIIHVCMRVMLSTTLIFGCYALLEWFLADTEASWSSVVWEKILLVAFCASIIVHYNAFVGQTQKQ